MLSSSLHKFESCWGFHKFVKHQNAATSYNNQQNCGNVEHCSLEYISHKWNINGRLLSNDCHANCIIHNFVIIQFKDRFINMFATINKEYGTEKEAAKDTSHRHLQIA